MVLPTEIVKHPSNATRINSLKNTIFNQNNIIKNLEKSLRVSETQRIFIDSEYKKLYENFRNSVRNSDEREEYNYNRITGLINALNNVDDNLKKLQDEYDELLDVYEKTINPKK